MTEPDDTPRPARLALSRDELLILNNALNEVCNGIDIEDFEFSARIGVDRDEARALMRRVTALYDEVARGAE